MEFELLKQVSQFGLLGVILALVWWIALQLWRDLKFSWEARITENKHLVSVIETTNTTYSALATATESRARANEAMSQAQQATSKAIEAQTRAIEAQTKALERVAQGNETLTRYMDKLMLQSDTLREEIKSAQRLVSQSHGVRRTN